MHICVKASIARTSSSLLDISILHGTRQQCLQNGSHAGTRNKCCIHRAKQHIKALAQHSWKVDSRPSPHVPIGSVNTHASADTHTYMHEKRNETHNTSTRTYASAVHRKKTGQRGENLLSGSGGQGRGSAHKYQESPQGILGQREQHRLDPLRYLAAPWKVIPRQDSNDLITLTMGRGKGCNNNAYRRKSTRFLINVVQ